VGRATESGRSFPPCGLLKPFSAVGHWSSRAGLLGRKKKETDFDFHFLLKGKMFGKNVVYPF
jgi:hypothetical protein